MVNLRKQDDELGEGVESKRKNSEKEFELRLPVNLHTYSLW